MTTKMPCDIIRMVCDKMPQLDELAIKWLRRNADVFASDVANLVVKHSAFGDKFELSNSFDIIIPLNYVHANQLANFAEYSQGEKDFNYFNPLITDENCSGISQPLIPGATYRIEIYDIKSSHVTSMDCLTLLGMQEAVLVGAPGLSLLRQFHPSKFLLNKWMISFNMKSDSWKDEQGFALVSHMGHMGYRDDTDGWAFDVNRFGFGWAGIYQLLCCIPFHGQ